MSGTELLRIVNQRFPEVRTFVLSGHSREIEAMELGDSGHQLIRKPFKSTDLLEILCCDGTDGGTDRFGSARQNPPSLFSFKSVESTATIPKKLRLDDQSPLNPASGGPAFAPYSIPLWLLIFFMVQWVLMVISYSISEFKSF